MTGSPCTKVCVMDAEQRYCVGCLRTLGEIARWGAMSEDERATVVAQLAARRSAFSSDVAEVPTAPLA